MPEISPALVKRFPALFLNHDIYERHYRVHKLLGRTKPGETVLDVGGEGHLDWFARRLNIKILNIFGPEAYDGLTIPYPDDSFDYAVSIDTIEHMPKHMRGQHIAELVRVARRRVVFCAPIGQPMQIQFQKKLLACGVMDERTRQFVREHLEFGLPTPEEIEAALPHLRIRWYYSGNLKFYTVPSAPPKSKLRRAALLFVSLPMNWLANRVWLHLKFGRRRKPTTNRFYGVIDLEVFG